MLVTVMLAAHLLAMNLASAGPLVGIWLVTIGKEDPWALERGRRMLRGSLAALAIGSLLGGALVIVPHEGLRSALRRFPESAYWFAGAELLFSAACMGALVAVGGRLLRHRRLAAALALLTSTNLLYHFPPLMAVIGELAADSSWATAQQIDRPALLRLWTRPEILSLWAHFTLASLAAAPIAAIWRTSHAEPQARAIRRLAGAALAASALQIPVGIWMLMTTSRAAQDSLLGSDLAASICFGAGVFGAIWLLQTLAAAAFGADDRAATRAGYLLVAVTLLMTATLRSTRTAGQPSRELAKPRSAVAADQHHADAGVAPPN